MFMGSRQALSMNPPLRPTGTSFGRRCEAEGRGNLDRHAALAMTGLVMVHGPCAVLAAPKLAPYNDHSDRRYGERSAAISRLPGPSASQRRFGRKWLHSTTPFS